MEELLYRFTPGQTIALVAVAGGLLCGIIGIIMGCWTEMRKVEITAALKQDMLNRGMSVDEIQTVMNAGVKQERDCHGKAMRTSGHLCHRL